MRITSRTRAPEISQQVIQVAGLPVRYEVAGAGHPLVLVHGLAGSTRWWYRNLPDLASGYRVYLLDLPGFGAMRRLRRPSRLTEAHSWMHSWMQAVGIERAHLVGHSMGGYVSMRLAADYPDAVDRLVLVSPAGVPMDRSLLGNLISLLEGGRRANPTFLMVLMEDALRAGPWNIWRFSQQLLAEDVRADLRSIVAPTLLIWGENDRIVPAALGPILRETIPNSRLLLMHGVAHVPMFDRPRQFNSALKSFLAGEAVGE